MIPATTPRPAGRAYSSGIYDPVESRFVIHAGFNNGGLSDTWALPLAVEHTWEQLQPGGIAPASRWIHSAIYDPDSGRMIIFGGVNTADLRELTWGTAVDMNPPVIQGLFPSFGQVGDAVTITGTSLGNASGVTFNGVSAEITGASYTVVQTHVPLGATSGLVTVTTPFGTAASSDSFVVGTRPTLLSAQPDSGKIDAIINLIGHDFTGVSSVSFSGTGTATFTIVSDSVIAVVVDPAAVTGPVTATNQFGTTTSSWTFRVLPWDPKPRIAAIKDAPNDQGGKVIVEWYASDYDAKRIKTVTGYRVWRRAPLDLISMASAGSNMRPMPVPRDAPWLGAAGEFWEPIGSVSAAQLGGYAFTAPTIQDSLSDSNPYTAFFIQALTSDALLFYSSSADSGYSVDNLSPPMPVPFVAQYGEQSNVLHWTQSSARDWHEFRLYRGVSPDFVPGSENLVIATRDTQYVDSRGGYYYKLSALDVHGNVSHYALVSPDVPLASVASGVSADEEADRITVTWYSGGNPGLAATVYRRTTASDWVALAPVVGDSRGYLRYEDTAVTTGSRYGYRLGIRDGGTEVFAGEIWATAQRPTLSLTGIVPNPGRGNTLAAHFVLASAEAARLELMDISGRRVSVSDVGSLGPGRHVIDLGRGSRLAPGVYLLRLTQGRRVATARAVILQ